MRSRTYLTLLFLIVASVLLSTVTVLSQQSCSEEHYQCGDGKCIFIEWHCDSHIDCDDGSDEDNCPTPASCGPNDFTCKGDGLCITGSWRCDGEFDCVDHSDERDCNCTTKQWRCSANDLCISINWRCDGDKDCEDGSDEKACSTPSSNPDIACKSYEFTCGNELCIPAEWTCDTHDDCGDASDERDELCGRRSCPGDQFTCDSGQCTFQSWVCDGERDCEDNSDEKNCNSTVTPTTPSDPCPQKFRCADEQDCIPQGWKCDGESDCFDSSDEKNCTVCSWGLLCDADKQCIGDHLTCDGQDDCTDGQDEKLDKCYITQPPTADPCSHPKFSCGDGKCLAESRVCDSTEDCSGGEDEADCINECEKGSHNCTRNEHCVDEAKGFKCECEREYERDSITGLCHVQCSLTECDQICSSKQTSYKCECFPDFQLHDDGTKCKQTGPNPYLLYVYNQAILRVDLVSQNEHVVVPNLRSPTALDYNYDEQVVYYSENVQHKIMVANISGDGTSEVLVEGDGMDGPDDLAYDWIHKYLFWTDGPRETVERYDFLSKKRIVLLGDNLDEPRPIVVHPFEGSGHIYFADWGNPAKIEKATIDGEDRRVLISKDIVWPNGLTLDVYRSQLYWSDAKLDYIKKMDLDGSNVQEILRSEGIHPHTLTVFNAELFWTDWVHKGILKQSDSSFEVVKGNLIAAHPLSIKVVHPHRQPRQEDFTPCIVDNGGCSHVCKNVNFKAECSCPPNQHLWEADNKACLLNAAQCPTDYTLCLNGGTCQASGTGIMCKCDIYHSGPRCEELVVQPCEVSNGGCSNVCVNGERQTAICRCPEGQTLNKNGKTCEFSTLLCPDYCKYGNCSASSRGPECKCYSGYQGLRCDVEVPDIGPYVFCDKYCEHGECNYAANGTECKCNEGYEGSTCASRISLPTEGEGDPKAVSDDSSTVGIAVGVACGIIVIVVIVLIILWLLKRNSGKDVHFENPVYTNTSDNVTWTKESGRKDQNNGVNDSKPPGTSI